MSRPVAARRRCRHPLSRKTGPLPETTSIIAVAPRRLRQAKKDRTQALLIREAMRLFAAKGYDVTSVDEIAAAAFISRRTLFRYFPAKADIVLAWTRGMTHVVATSLDACPLDLPLEEALLRAFVPVIPHVSPRRKDAYALIYLIERTPTLRSVSLQKYSEWEDNLARALEPRMPPSETPTFAARLIARTAIATFRTALDEWIRSRGGVAFDPLLRHAFDLQCHVWRAAQAMPQQS